MEAPVLTDSKIFPTEEIISSYTGRTWKIWQDIFSYLHNNHPDIAEEWRYYNDGKSWLMKVTRKGKTVFWLKVIKNSFITTFYFTDKANSAIMKSSLPAELKEAFNDGRRFNNIRGITIKYRNKKNIKDFETLLAIKLNAR